MANNKKGDMNVDNDSDAVNSHSSYAKKTQSIERNFIASAQAQDQAAKQEIAQKQIANPAEIRNIHGKHHKKAKAGAARLLNTLAQPGSTSAEVASLAHLEKTRKNVAGSSLMGMSDELLEEMYQHSMDKTLDYRSKAANSVRTAGIGTGGTPQLNKSYYESIAGGTRGAQEAANIKAAINERRRTGVSNVKVESAIQETQSRRAGFTEDADLKRQISENKLSRKDVEARYEEDYSRFEKTKRGKGKLADRARSLIEERNERSKGLDEVVEQQVFLSGGNKSAADVIKENPALQAAQKAIENLDKQLVSVGKATVKADKELLGYNQSLSKQEKLLKSMPKEGMAGFMQGGGGDAMIEAMGTAAQMYRRHAVGIPMREEKGKAGIANLALSRYNKQFAATQGDMTALYEIMQDRGGGAEAFGKQMKLRSQISSGVETGLDATAAAIAATQLLTGNGSSTASNKTMATIAKVGAKALKGTEALAKGFGENAVVGAETKLEAILTRDQYNAAIAGIKSQGGQALYNQVMGAADVSVGAGNATALEEKLTSASGMQDAVTRGNLSPEQFIQATAQVGQSVYGANHDRGDIAIRAGEMQKKRVMSADQYTQAMGIQSAAGGSAGGLESTLKRAVAAGVNDSKLLVEFVQLSANLNQSLADIGVSAENHTAYSNKVQQMKEAGVSEVLATRAAASEIGAIDAMLRDTSINEGSVLKAGVIQKMLGPGATDAERFYMQKADSGAISLMTKDTLTEKERESLTPVQKKIRARTEKDLKKSQEYANEMGDIAAGTAAGTLHLKGSEDFVKMTQIGTGARDTDAKNVMNFKDSGKSADLKTQEGVQEKTKQNKDQAILNQLTQAVSKELGGIKETFEVISKAMAVYTKELDANKAAAGAEKAASKLDPDGTFGTAVTNFDRAVVKLLKGVGLTPAEKAATDNASKKPSAGMGFQKPPGQKPKTRATGQSGAYDFGQN